MTPYDEPLFYRPLYRWERDGENTPDRWDLVETFQARHRHGNGSPAATLWERDPHRVAEYATHLPRHRAAS